MEIFFFFVWLGSIIIGLMIGSKKGEGCISGVMLVLLGPLWLPVVILSTGNRKKCPHCREYVDKTATACPHCTRSITEGPQNG